jgi:hypothetical protein
MITVIIIAINSKAVRQCKPKMCLMTFISNPVAQSYYYVQYVHGANHISNIRTKIDILTKISVVPCQNVRIDMPWFKSALAFDFFFGCIISHDSIFEEESYWGNHDCACAHLNDHYPLLNLLLLMIVW